jgi:hypothetical protein
MSGGVRPNNKLQRSESHGGRTVRAKDGLRGSVRKRIVAAAEQSVRAKACGLTHRRIVYTIRLCGFPGMKGSVVST